MIKILFNSNHIKGILQDRGLSNLNDDSLWQVKTILNELDEEQLLRNSKKVLSSDYAKDKATATFLRAIVEQNWVMITQNDQILKELKLQNQAPKE
ncbi:hypothetical protein [Liquorilactobacillus nagelii]|jgi:hypothetical protein|uniref:hypothetical protein n=1 Tax=Liquorilactobacillus nagelii TaxID=82688 RepID=UPI001CCC7E46|nr:hypothetical protein [Liquorilactobacillus nagelii]MCI1699488.1 hypothetical protein [Liquorilactobacillus nagelii]ULQ50516.1 hypothetical protein J6864_04890 [Liquorilactobacillus nagelii]